MRLRLVVPLLLIASVLALAACGGGSDETAKVEEVVETSATSTDPADCKKLETKGFMEQVSQERGRAALAECEEEAENGENAESVEISNVEVAGAGATADVVLSGGGASLEGQTLKVALVKDGDQWKLNEVVEFAKFDKAKLVEGVEKEIEKSGELSSKFAACFIEAFKRADQAEVEELLFGSGKGFEEIARSCSSARAS